MTTLDIITIILFSLGVVLVGLAFSQKGKSMELQYMIFGKSNKDQNEKKS